MPLSRLLVSVALLFAASALALPEGVAHAAGDRKTKMRKDTGRHGKEPGQAARRERERRAAPAHGHQQGRPQGRHGGGHMLAPNERQNLRQSVYDAMRDIYHGG
ncbi:hypothetical protein [Imbroritus primus]|jgi:hypothetical protein|uniref:hypothetical protein n=1 Tax=Imbroritus primus TaxID=3058603 RepID=UPI003D160778